MQGRWWIDLAVFTHLDADHIGNAHALLADAELGLKFRDIWFNGYDQAGQAARADRQTGHVIKSFPQAESLSVRIESAGLPHNRAFGGGPVVVPDGQEWLTIHFGEEADGADAPPVLTLLSPTLHRLSRLAVGWDRYRDRFERGEDDTAADGSGLQDRMQHKAAAAPAEDFDLEEMARLPVGEDRSLPNGSSIAFILEHHGRQLLFLGDAYADDYELAYSNWREAHPSAEAPQVVKLSHHGSRNNTSSRVAVFGASNYLVSTNGQHFGHPDDAALARLVVDAPEGSTPKFWFNYPTPTARRWAERAQRDPRFEVELPAGVGAGCGISLCELKDG